MIQNRLPNHIRIWAALVLFGVFAIGAVCGAAIGHIFRDRRIPPPMMGHIPIHELGLSDAQRRQVDEIFEAHRPELDAVLDEMFPKIRSVNDEIEKDVLRVLNDEQKKRFESLKSRRPHGPHHRPHGEKEGPFDETLRKPPRGEKAGPPGETFVQPQRVPPPPPMPEKEVLPPREGASEAK